MVQAIAGAVEALGKQFLLWHVDGLGNHLFQPVRRIGQCRRDRPAGDAVLSRQGGEGFVEQIELGFNPDAPLSAVSEVGEHAHRRGLADRRALVKVRFGMNMDYFRPVVNTIFDASLSRGGKVRRKCRRKRNSHYVSTSCHENPSAQLCYGSAHGFPPESGAPK